MCHYSNATSLFVKDIDAEAERLKQERLKQYESKKSKSMLLDTMSGVCWLLVLLLAQSKQWSPSPVSS